MAIPHPLPTLVPRLRYSLPFVHGHSGTTATDLPVMVPRMPQQRPFAHHPWLPDLALHFNNHSSSNQPCEEESCSPTEQLRGANDTSAVTSRPASPDHTRASATVVGARHQKIRVLWEPPAKMRHLSLLEQNLADLSCLAWAMAATGAHRSLPHRTSSHWQWEPYQEGDTSDLR